MQSKISFTVTPLAFVLSLLLLTTLGTAQARKFPYPSNQCAASKQLAAGAYCRAALRAWGGWDKRHNDTKRDSALTMASTRLTNAWANAEKASTKKGVDCADLTFSLSEVQTAVDGVVTATVADVNSGLTLTIKSQAHCGTTLLGATARRCRAFLNAEANYIIKLSAGKTKRDTAQTNAHNRFQTTFTMATKTNCPTAATAAGLESRVDTLVADVVTNTTVSPNVDATQSTTIAPTGTIAYQGRSLTPLCSRDTPYYFFVKRGSLNKVLMYYQGGGACWDYITCHLGIFDQSVDPNGSDNPNNQNAGFGDLNNPDNPFKDWTIIFTSYCTGDIHFGDKHQDYTAGAFVEHVNHYGYQNARVVEKWAREHFVNPDEVFVTGSSAGAYGAFFNAPLLEQVWPDSKFSVLADAGNGVITNAFLQNNFAAWDFEKNIPTTIPGVVDALHNGSGIPGYTQAVAAYYPNTAWAHYATAYDGGTGGQTGFYNVMLNPTNIFAWPNWWNASCAWHGLMRQQAVATAAAVTTGNYRYYIGRGSRHTGWGSNTVVYNDDAIGITPALKDWTTSMRNRDAGWVNVECTDCVTTLPGDPKPSPLQSPFQQNGPDVVISCP